jgi:hypothetical protein
MTRKEFNTFVGPTHEDDVKLAKEIDRRYSLSGNYVARMQQYQERRRIIAAAYMAGASLTQIAILERTSANGVHNLVKKEIDADTLRKIAQERTGRGRRLRWTPDQVSTMFAVGRQLEKIGTTPVEMIAARMQDSAIAQAFESYVDSEEKKNEGNPHLYTQTQASPADVRAGQDGRGDGD